MRPLVAKLEANCSGKVDFAILNVDNPSTNELSRQYDVRTIPRFILLDGEGRIVQQWIGSGDESRFNPVLSYCQTSQVP
jgi:thioredoxin-related protein